jgi:hypothetical protein
MSIETNRASALLRAEVSRADLRPKDYFPLRARATRRN